jgi:hypothetical protein
MPRYDIPVWHSKKGGQRKRGEKRTSRLYGIEELLGFGEVPSLLFVRSIKSQLLATMPVPQGRNFKGDPLGSKNLKKSGGKQRGGPVLEVLSVPILILRERF